MATAGAMAATILRDAGSGSHKMLQNPWVSLKIGMTSRHLRLMAEIRLTTKDDDYPIIYRVSYIPGGAGFQPSIVCTLKE